VFLPADGVGPHDRTCVMAVALVKDKTAASTKVTFSSVNQTSSFVAVVNPAS